MPREFQPVSRLRSYCHAFRRTLPSRGRLLFWLAKTSQFGVWQLLSQTIQFVTGFLIVRSLSYEAYAQYGLTLSFQSMLALLVDLGFSGSILALVGQRIDDREVVGRYMGAALRQRTRLMLMVIPLSVPAFSGLPIPMAGPSASVSCFTSPSSRPCSGRAGSRSIHPR